MIGRGRPVMVAAGGLFEAAFLTRLKLIITHQPGNPVASGDDTVLDEIGMHARASISLPRETKTLADMGKKHHVLALAFTCGAAFPSEIAGDGATWLDRRPTGRDQCPLAKSGFGAGVREALDRRADELVRQGHAWRTPEGEGLANANLIGILQHKKVERAGRELAAEPRLAFVPVEDGLTVRGKLLGSVQLGSGRFAMIGDGLGFSLVP